jgi:hypothetical protein
VEILDQKKRNLTETYVCRRQDRRNEKETCGAALTADFPLSRRRDADSHARGCGGCYSGERIVGCVKKITVFIRCVLQGFIDDKP